jgi:hypothetical protein
VIGRQVAGAAAALAALVLAGCGPRRPAGEGPGYPGELQPPERFASDFLLRQELEVQLGGERTRFQAALQRRGATLTLLVLTPMGTRAFVIEQQGLDVRFTSYLPEGREPPFPPRYVLLDVQRTLLPQLGDGPLADGEHRGERAGEVIRERWLGGRLLERRFARRGGRPAGEIVLAYEGGMAPGEAPSRVVLDNGWLGYRLVITTLSSQDL